ncbi:hypothetical protein KO504_10340 [Winogradskyella psychrotolerans]|uniref:hypothetical protein n=1 Tax=Winogradskyella psychrotolerans TaxID=1344585 RepID=UPI001C065EEF|nr:hypothetical protein [Winogradskyella psychrotolerans]MBU2921741.1 hypothetical protein [Winogradskyella psychrotolerans]
MKNKYAIVLILTLLIFSSCSKSSDNNDTTLNEEFGAQFSGNMITGNINNDIEGVVSISETGNFILESFSGRLTGNAELENNIYTITNISGNGAFESSTFSDGQLNLDNLNLNIEGTYIDSTPIAINGEIEIIWIEEYEQMWTDARTKSSVFFSHNELCSASITINGITLYGLGTHYNENGALCDQSTYGDLFTTKYHRDVDNDISETLCNTQTLFNPLTGEYNTSEWCTISKFIVDKNTQYTYTVDWDNGYSYTDTFMSADGGQAITICPTNPLEDCDDFDSGNGNNQEQEIIENTIIIDYANSETIENGQFNFSNLCSLESGSNHIIIFGDENSPSRIRLSTYILDEGIYNFSDPYPSTPKIYARIISDGILYDYSPTGSFEVTFIERYPDSGGEIHLTFNEVSVDAFFPNLGNNIEFSGTLKARWE